MKSSSEIIRTARSLGIGIPAFNIAHLPMTEPVIRAVADQDSFALIEVSRIDWMKFGARSPAAVIDEFNKWMKPDHVRMHLDHVPVIDEDGKRVDYRAVISDAISRGYQSVMVDASRLQLEENIRATREVAEIAHKAGVPCESELGAVLGHEAGPLPPYEELFASGRGFTDPGEAARFVRETGCDWLSVAVGNIHGAISGAARDRKKVEARLNVEHLRRLFDATGVPLVLHGGSGIQAEYLRQAVQNGIAKINIGTEIRQAFERGIAETGEVAKGQEAVAESIRNLVREVYRIEGSAKRLE